MKEVNLKVRQEIIDIDYLNKLSPDEKAWLNQFNKEFVNADFSDDENRLHPREYVAKVVKSSGRRRKVDVYKKECEHMNNARNRDAHAVTKVNNMLKGETSFPAAENSNRSTSVNETEDVLIDLLDNGPMYEED